ncbi:hypothetical protein B7494_g6360 [Chlorociboria aeruginascens]|nr:hypothetical protein B7494_g6360 [Chlorociboria aeruginascens]
MQDLQVQGIHKYSTHKFIPTIHIISQGQATTKNSHSAFLTAYSKELNHLPVISLNLSSAFTVPRSPCPGNWQLSRSDDLIDGTDGLQKEGAGKVQESVVGMEGIQRTRWDDEPEGTVSVANTYVEKERGRVNEKRLLRVVRNGAFAWVDLDTGDEVGKVVHRVEEGKRDGLLMSKKVEEGGSRVNSGILKMGGGEMMMSENMDIVMDNKEQDGKRQKGDEEDWRRRWLMEAENNGLKQDGTPDKRVGTGEFAQGKVDPHEAGKQGGHASGGNSASDNSSGKGGMSSVIP